jgi:hypothetical protein
MTEAFLKVQVKVKFDNMRLCLFAELYPLSGEARPVTMYNHV